LQPLIGIQSVHIVSTLTEASLLSGTPTRERARDASGGLLRRIGDFGIILYKDFTSMLAMNRDTRGAVLAALREIYDGSWTRQVGVDGGKTLQWQGKVGLIGACTSTIDAHHSVISAMGERFIMYRLPTINEDQLAARALEHQGSEAAMRKELSRDVSNLFSGLTLNKPEALVGDEKTRIIALATLSVRCRSAVERDGRTRDIELIAESESPGRLVLALSQLLAGVTAIGAHRSDAWQVVTKVALDCIPALRFRVIQRLAEATRAMETAVVADLVNCPLQTTRRALEDLTLHGVVSRIGEGQGKGGLWYLSDWTKRKCNEGGITFPEMSEQEYGSTFPEKSDRE
jgi:hypothetical protein